MKTLVKRNRFFPEVPSFYDEFFNSDWFDYGQSNFPTRTGTLPAVNIKETDSNYELEIAAPGMKKEDFKVELDNNMLTISSEKEVKNKEKEDNYTRREFSYQSFYRSFNLPENKVEGNKITAQYTDGILHLSIPKKEEAKVQATKMIKVS